MRLFRYHPNTGWSGSTFNWITDWEFGQDDLLGFARELMEKNQ